jgi:hypothetical protein
MHAFGSLSSLMGVHQCGIVWGWGLVKRRLLGRPVTFKGNVASPVVGIGPCEMCTITVALRFCSEALNSLRAVFLAESGYVRMFVLRGAGKQACASLGDIS